MFLKDLTGRRYYYYYYFFKRKLTKDQKKSCPLISSLF